MVIPRRFGEKLRFLRQSQKLTLSELAASLGYRTHSYLSEIESGQKAPTVHLVLKVADFFQVSTDALIRDDVELITDSDNTRS
jgi:transcriptional regulator with XRE-family HTH domain